VAKAAPDGYEFMIGHIGTHAQYQTIYKHPLYDAATDFAPVALLVEQPQVLITRKDLPADDLSGFIAYGKAHPGTMRYSSGPATSPTYINCVLLNTAIGVNATHVPNSGSGPALQDLIAGRIDYMCSGVAAAKPLIEGNRVKAVAILSKDRSPALPNVQSAHEQGLTDFETAIWFAFFLPKGYTRSDRPEAQRRHRRSDEHIVRAAAAGGTWRDAGRTRTPVTGVPTRICRE
jgi:tripartite-type tricarboxylate transporter receptor subunit TctC